MFVLPFVIFLGNRLLLNALSYLFTYGNILPIFKKNKYVKGTKGYRLPVIK